MHDASVVVAAVNALARVIRHVEAGWVRAAPPAGDVGVPALRVTVFHAESRPLHLTVRCTDHDAEAPPVGVASVVPRSCLRGLGNRPGHRQAHVLDVVAVAAPVVAAGGGVGLVAGDGAALAPPDHDRAPVGAAAMVVDAPIGAPVAAAGAGRDDAGGGVSPAAGGGSGAAAPVANGVAPAHDAGGAGSGAPVGSGMVGTRFLDADSRQDEAWVAQPSLRHRYAKHRVDVGDEQMALGPHASGSWADE